MSAVPTRGPAHLLRSQTIDWLAHAAFPLPLVVWSAPPHFDVKGSSVPREQNIQCQEHLGERS